MSIIVEPTRHVYWTTPTHPWPSSHPLYIHTQAGAAAQLAALQGQEHAQGEPAYKPGTLHLDVDQHDFHEVRRGCFVVLWDIVWFWCLVWEVVVAGVID